MSSVSRLIVCLFSSIEDRCLSLGYEVDDVHAVAENPRVCSDLPLTDACKYSLDVLLIQDSFITTQPGPALSHSSKVI